MKKIVLIIVIIVLVAFIFLRKEKEADFKLLYPAGGEAFCLGDEVKIEWEYKKDLENVKIMLSNTNEGIKFLIDTAPANNNSEEGKGSYSWKAGYVGDKITFNNKDFTYKIGIVDDNDPYKTALDASGIFAIHFCE